MQRTPTIHSMHDVHDTRDLGLCQCDVSLVSDPDSDFAEEMDNLLTALIQSQFHPSSAQNADSRRVDYLLSSECRGIGASYSDNFMVNDDMGIYEPIRLLRTQSPCAPPQIFRKHLIENKASHLK